MSFVEKVKNIIEGINRKIRKIRHSDQKTKRNWLILSTTIAMILIIGLWVWYINFTVSGISDINKESNSSENNDVETGIDKPEAVNVFIRGFVVIKNAITQKIKRASSEVKFLIQKTKDSFNNVKEYTPNASSSIPFESQ